MISELSGALDLSTREAGPTDDGYNWRFRAALDRNGLVLHEWREPPPRDDTWIYAPACWFAPGGWSQKAWLELARDRE